MTTAFLLLGSNLGDRALVLKKATTQLGSEVEVIRKSAVYESEAWGFESSGQNFYNQVVVIKTDLPAKKLMDLCLKIENNLGRKRNDSEGYEDRIIDIDILYFGSEIITTRSLTVPHPRLPERKFALLPMSELSPDFIHPILKKTQVELLEQVEDKGWIKRIN